jgi:hypothetical protein
LPLSSSWEREVHSPPSCAMEHPASGRSGKPVSNSFLPFTSCCEAV